MNQWKSAHAVDTDARTLADALVGADVFIGLSAKGAVTKEMVASMAASPIIFAMANPDPEISPEDVLSVRSDAIIATADTTVGVELCEELFAPDRLAVLLAGAPGAPCCSCAFLSHATAFDGVRRGTAANASPRAAVGPDVRPGPARTSTWHSTAWRSSPTGVAATTSSANSTSASAS